VRLRHVLVACGLVAAACAALPVFEPAPAPAPSAQEVRVKDGAGRVVARPAAAVAREADRGAGSDLLERHLAQVEYALDAPLVRGNDGALLIDGPATHRAMFDAIGRARDHVNLQTYILEATGPGEALAALLIRKRAQGVKVNVLYDSVGSMGTPQEFFERLRAAGIAVCEFNPVNPLKSPPRGWQINNRDHRKILVVDGRVAFTGGINISGVYSAGSFGSARRAPSREAGWRDTHVLTRGPIVAEFQRVFLDAWSQQRCETPVPAAYYPRTGERGDWIMRVVAADPAAGASPMYVALLSALDQAERRAWLTYGYFVPDPATVDALKRAAARGVDVRLVLPGFSDFWAPLYAGRSHYDELLGAKVRIFERHDALLHAKTAVIDGVWSSVGSTNLDWRSFVHNYEADVIVLGDAFARSLERLFDLDVQASHEITPEAWARRGVVDRAREWFARRWEYLL
jgi:cardiolipin synthase